MKQFLALSAILCATVGAQADLVLQQQITAAKYTGVTTMKVKGTKVRLDLYAGQPQAVSTLTDLSTGENITLMHNQKMFLKTPGTPMNQARPSGTASKAPLPQNTGKKQKVGDYDTELYSWSNARGITGTAWVAKNYPDFARIKADLAMLDKTADADDDTSPQVSLLPGMVVRSQVSGGGQTLTLALISAKEGSVDSSNFVIPRDYKEMPKVKPLQPVAAPPSTQKPPGGPVPKGSAAHPNTSTQKPPGW